MYTNYSISVIKKTPLKWSTRTKKVTIPPTSGPLILHCKYSLGQNRASCNWGLSPSKWCHEAPSPWVWVEISRDTSIRTAQICTHVHTHTHTHTYQMQRSMTEHKKCRRLRKISKGFCKVWSFQKGKKERKVCAIDRCLLREKELKRGADIWSSNSTPGHISRENCNSKRTLYSNIHSSTIYNSQDMEATWMSTAGWVDKVDVVHLLYIHTMEYYLS